MCKECKNEVKEKVRKVFLDDLPKWENGKNKGCINWTQSIGQKIRGIYEDLEFEVEIVDCSNKYLYIQYKNRKIFKIQKGNFKKCGLGKLLGVITEEFKVKIGQIFQNDKRDLIVIDKEYREQIKRTKNNRIQNCKYYRYKCNKCGFEGWVNESNLLNGQNCSCCANQTVVEGINDIPTVAPWMIPYFQGGYDEAKLYTKTSNKKINPICPDCGRIKNKMIIINGLYKTHSIGCSCSDGQSYPFKIMYNILEQLKIEFRTEYSPKWIKPKRYDFYFEIDEKKYIVETDGKFHSNDNKMNGQTKEESKWIDDYKDELADEYGIKVIRVNSDISELEYIKNNILESKLSELFDLSHINWLKVEKFALSNRVLEACRLKKDNPNFTTSEIGKIMNLNRQTIRRYLKKGGKIWDWFDYSPNEERKKSIARNGKKRGKPVEIFNKDGISLGEFESCSELERQSEKKFGVKLLITSITSVCRGKQKRYKGYTFRYVN